MIHVKTNITWNVLYICLFSVVRWQCLVFFTTKNHMENTLSRNIMKPCEEVLLNSRRNIKCTGHDIELSIKFRAQT